MTRKSSTLRSGWISRKLFTYQRMIVCIIPSQPQCVWCQTCLVVKKQVTICGSAIEACKDAEAVVIATEWKEFREIPWEDIYADMKKPAFVFDGRLLVDADKLRSIGFKVG
jgi:UDP-N-acetyl-D-mannosaminuronate dehydrogenase